MSLHPSACLLYGLRLLIPLLGGAAFGASAQSTAGASMAPAAVQTAPANDSLFRALGAQAGVKRLSDDFIDRMLADPRVKGFFKDTKLSRLRDKLYLQFCAVSGGPCVYDGDDMKEVHEGMKLGKGDFNAVVELLQDAMDNAKIPFSTQNQFLALLAPMHRDIITR
jgi:hemoglobin